MKHFREYNHDLTNDPRVSVFLDDGRHFVERARPESYDVVTMEPPPPTAPGVHALYSLEFYKAVRRVLREDGVLLQWVPLYWLTPNEARGVVKTVAKVFPYTFIVRMGQIDFVTLSFKRDGPPRWSIEWIEERAKIFAGEREVMRKRWTSKCRHGTASLEGILALLTAGPEDVARLEAPYIYEDDDQRLSDSSGDRRLLRRYHGTILPALTFAALPRTPFSELQRYFREPIPAAELDEERARALMLYGVPSPAEVDSAVEAWREATDLSARAERALRIAKLAIADFDESLAWIGKGIASDPSIRDPGWIGKWAAYHANLHARELGDWIDSLPPRARSCPIARIVKDELAKFRERERRQREGYLLHRLF